MAAPLASPLRWAGAALLVVTSGTHIPLIPAHLHEAPYVGALFIGQSVASAGLASLLVTRDTPAVWAATAVLTVLAVTGFLASRTVGLPQIGDDVGNWSEPLWFPALAAELFAATTAVLALRQRTHPFLHPEKSTP